MTAVRAVWYSIDYCCILIFFLMIRRPPRSTRTDTPFPTRRSSDLEQLRDHQVGRRVVDRHAEEDDALPQQARPDRSEEHTSELQSLMRISYAVFRLKKKRTKQLKLQPQINNTHIITQQQHNKPRVFIHNNYKIPRNHLDYRL